MSQISKLGVVGLPLPALKNKLLFILLLLYILLLIPTVVYKHLT